MGDLIKSPHSELNGFLERLDALGVKSEHLARFRAGPLDSWLCRGLQRVMMGDRMAWSSLSFGDDLKLMGIQPSDLDAVQGDDVRMRSLLATLKPQAPATADFKPKWREEGGIIYFTLPLTDGTTGEQWIRRLEAKGFALWDEVKTFLGSSAFVPTSGVTYEVAVLKGELSPNRGDHLGSMIYLGLSKGWHYLHPEASCLIREMFSDVNLKMMDVGGIAVVSEGEHHLCANHVGLGRSICTYVGAPHSKWYLNYGFAFVATHVPWTSAY